MSLMTWTVPLGNVRTAESRAISAIAASTFGNRSANGRRRTSPPSRVFSILVLCLFMSLLLLLAQLGRARHSTRAPSCALPESVVGGIGAQKRAPRQGAADVSLAEPSLFCRQDAGSTLRFI